MLCDTRSKVSGEHVLAKTHEQSLECSSSDCKASCFVCFLPRRDYDAWHEVLLRLRTTLVLQRHDLSRIIIMNRLPRRATQLQGGGIPNETNPGMTQTGS